MAEGQHSKYPPDVLYNIIQDVPDVFCLCFMLLMCATLNLCQERYKMLSQNVLIYRRAQGVFSDRARLYLREQTATPTDLYQSLLPLRVPRLFSEVRSRICLPCMYENRIPRGMNLSMNSNALRFFFARQVIAPIVAVVGLLYFIFAEGIYKYQVSPRAMMCFCCFFFFQMGVVRSHLLSGIKHLSYCTWVRICIVTMRACVNRC